MRKRICLCQSLFNCLNLSHGALCFCVSGPFFSPDKLNNEAASFPLRLPLVWIVFRELRPTATSDPDAPPHFSLISWEAEPVWQAHTQTNTALFKPLLINENIILVEWSLSAKGRGPSAYKRPVGKRNTYQLSVSFGLEKGVQLIYKKNSQMCLEV